MVNFVDVAYAYNLVDLAFDVGGIYYAYRLSRLTGAFTGWVFMIAAVVLITAQNLSAIATLVLLEPAPQSIVFSGGGIIPSATLGTALSLTVFGAMYGLYQAFRRLEKGKPNE